MEWKKHDDIIWDKTWIRKCRKEHLETCIRTEVLKLLMKRKTDMLQLQKNSKAADVDGAIRKKKLQYYCDLLIEWLRNLFNMFVKIMPMLDNENILL